MTPGINALKKAGVPFSVHEYDHAPDAPSYGLEAAEKMGTEPGRVFKTLVAAVDGQSLVVGIVPVNSQLSMKRLARAAKGKKAAMADPEAVQRSTGYVLGGVSPLGQKRRLATFIDDSAQRFGTVFVSAGRRGLEIELAPADLARLLNASFTPLQQE
ncbi:Cys-tRNA(Pro) deacylase [Marinobacter salinisoli]|uniref:Cys-tRNA(Pro)/Cys-tRNA(Cys) deacylase n=1 Tax=Marinobacter salinisoli TaxID=2769486 RepID=A0ABX7MZM7_9GAMM|nr:Cys-tRNA(Pro) deacylase [Marinobacter salinisoli]QSP95643.1 Cys-tRNA(Pro) deacylase [Marinobacter salinisoli]